ncbi:MAG: ribonuclease III [Verrucomicrobiota bacterium]
MGDAGDLQCRIGYQFKDQELLRQALTHPSLAVVDPKQGPSNQRLEFLGDAVLQLVVSQHLFEENPEADEGDLTRMRASLVCGSSLAAIAQSIGLSEYLLVSRSAKNSRVQQNEAAIEDAIEALIGAIFLDGGFDAVIPVITKIFPTSGFDRDMLIEEEENPKGALQELIQAKGDEQRPVYEIQSAEGPPHERVFTASVSLGDRIIGSGKGLSKKAAETEAAVEGLLYLKSQDPV